MNHECPTPEQINAAAAARLNLNRRETAMGLTDSYPLESLYAYHGILAKLNALAPGEIFRGVMEIVTEDESITSKRVAATYFVMDAFTYPILQAAIDAQAENDLETFIHLYDIAEGAMVVADAILDAEAELAGDTEARAFDSIGRMREIKKGVLGTRPTLPGKPTEADLSLGAEILEMKREASAKLKILNRDLSGFLLVNSAVTVVENTPRELKAASIVGARQAAAAYRRVYSLIAG